MNADKLSRSRGSLNNPMNTSISQRQTNQKDLSDVKQNQYNLRSHSKQLEKQIESFKEISFILPKSS